MPACLLQLVSGDISAKSVAEWQPAKLAAMEGHFVTRKRAPLRLGGIPDEATRTTPYSLEIPGVHSIQSAAAPRITLRLVAIGLAAGSCILLPALWYLVRVLKSDEKSAFVRVDTAEYKVPG